VLPAVLEVHLMIQVEITAAQDPKLIPFTYLPRDRRRLPRIVHLTHLAAVPAPRIVHLTCLAPDPASRAPRRTGRPLQCMDGRPLPRIEMPPDRLRPHLRMALKVTLKVIWRYFTATPLHLCVNLQLRLHGRSLELPKVLLSLVSTRMAHFDGFYHVPQLSAQILRMLYKTQIGGLP
jgi:hypothetical protein